MTTNPEPLDEYRRRSRSLQQETVDGPPCVESYELTRDRHGKEDMVASDFIDGVAPSQGNRP